MKVPAILITVLAFITYVDTAHAHRLSGHPKTLKGQLRLALAQVKHDKLAGENHWLKLDRAYVRKLQRLIYLARQRTLYPAHMPGWLCIHSREGAWNSNTGNGYYGGLQMTHGWMGLVGYAHLLTPLQQMRAAETGYQRSGYSHSWLAGQWPNTYPPCGAYF